MKAMITDRFFFHRAVPCSSTIDTRCLIVLVQFTWKLSEKTWFATKSSTTAWRSQSATQIASPEVRHAYNETQTTSLKSPEAILGNGSSIPLPPHAGPEWWHRSVSTDIAYTQLAKGNQCTRYDRYLPSMDTYCMLADRVCERRDILPRHDQCLRIDHRVNGIVTKLHVLTEHA
jgi:hypothetical protein